MKPLILVDFDGTIVRQDATDLILEHFALPQWREVEQDWVAGRIGSRECLARQVDFVRATETELRGLIATLDVDPAFPAFTRLCQDLGYDVMVGSDGLDRVIGETLAHVGVDVPYASNHLVQTGPDRWRMEFPHFRDSCKVASGTCKCDIADPSDRLAILVGDGRSDFCVAARAKFVLAKGALAHHCRANHIPHIVIAGFADAIEAMHVLSRQLPGHSTKASGDILSGASHA